MSVPSPYSLGEGNIPEEVRTNALGKHSGVWVAAWSQGLECRAGKVPILSVRLLEGLKQTAGAFGSGDWRMRA